VEERDINQAPPTRAFLEKHIEADRFLDFVSTRSPVFKQRPLPRSKREAEPDQAADPDPRFESDFRFR
jgi:hypothetical protein